MHVNIFLFCQFYQRNIYLKMACGYINWEELMKFLSQLKYFFGHLFAHVPVVFTLFVLCHFLLPFLFLKRIRQVVKYRSPFIGVKQTLFSMKSHVPLAQKPFSAAAIDHSFSSSLHLLHLATGGDRFWRVSHFDR